MQRRVAHTLEQRWQATVHPAVDEDAETDTDGAVAA
jgi:hypothetical protein